MAAETLSLLPKTEGLIQQGANYILWIFIGLVVAALIGYLLFRLFQNGRYRIIAVVYEKIGKTHVSFIDKIREVRLGEMKMFHYMKLKKYSNAFDSKFFRLYREYTLFGPVTRKAITLLKDGDKLVPCKIEYSNIEPIDYDAWNYLINMIGVIKKRYERNETLYRLLPFVALGGVIIAFIVGSILWGQHVEKVATLILNKASEHAMQMAQIIK